MSRKTSEQRNRARLRKALLYEKAGVVPEVAEICRLVSSGMQLPNELWKFVMKCPHLVRLGLVYHGVKFKLSGSSPSVMFVPLEGHEPKKLRQMTAACNTLRDCPEVKIELAVTAQPRKIRSPNAAFYGSAEWSRLRYDAIRKSDGRCQCCGRSKHDGIVLNVDHIKPIRTHPGLMRDPNNLQVMCNVCNRGKGNRDATDWRRRRTIGSTAT